MAYGAFEFPNASFYDSDLRELLAMYKKLLAEYDTILATVEALNKRVNDLYNYVDAEIAEAVKKALAEVNAKIEVINEKITTINGILAAQEEKINNLKQCTDTRFTEERNITDSTIEQTRKEIEADIRKLTVEFSTELLKLWEYVQDLAFNLPPIYNPVTGRYEAIPKAVEDIWNAVRVHALTVARYSAGALTVDEYKALRLTATEYAVQGRSIIEPPEAVNRLAGNWTTVNNAIASAGQVGAVNSLSAAEYAALSLTAEEYAEKEWTVVYYAYHSKDGVKESNIGKSTFVPLLSFNYSHNLGISKKRGE